MAAILELIIALFIEPLLGLLDALLRLLSFMLELFVRVIAYLFLYLTKGREVASQYFREHKPALKPPSAKKFPEHSEAEPAEPATPRKKIPAIYGWMLWFLLVMVVVGVVVNNQIQHSRQLQTKQQIRGLVKEFATMIRDKEPGAEQLGSGKLDKLDAWQRPLKLVVDRWAVGTLVVVRSAGRDGQMGTSDDLLAVDGVAPPGIPGFLKKAIKERLGRILGAMDLEQLPVDWVFDDK